MDISIPFHLVVLGSIFFVFLCLITVLDPRVGIIGALVWPYLQYLFTRDLNLLPGYLTLLDEVFLLCLLIAFILNVARRPSCLKVTLFDITLIMFVAFAILSSVLNKSPLSNMILSLRYYFQYVILYYVISYFDFKISFKYFILFLMLTLSVIQVPLTLYQYLTWTPSEMVTNRADSAYGTFGFGAANILGLMMLTFAMLVAKVQLNINNSLKYTIIIILFIGMVLAHSKLSYVILFAIILFQQVIKPFHFYNIKRIMVSVMLSVFLLFSATYVSDDVKCLLSLDGISQIINNQFIDTPGGGRILFFLRTIDVLESHSFSPLLGLGPGTYTSYAGINLSSQYLSELHDIDLEARGTRFDSELTGMVGEYGYIGFMLFSILIFSLYKRTSFMLNQNISPFCRSFADWFKLFILIYYFGGFIYGIWQAQFFAVNFWVCAGLLNSFHIISIFKLKTCIPNGTSFLYANEARQ